MPKNVRVVPAILTDDPKALETMVRQAETFADYIQLDIMDGVFVPSHSINSDAIRRLPMKLKWEAHLMVHEPARYFADFRLAGARKVIFHFEAVKSPQRTIAQARKFGLKVGVAINPETPASAVMPLAPEVESILLLSVHPGFYGARFIPKVMQKIAALRPSGLEIGIDGGIKETNIEEVARSGVNDIYVGSAIFQQSDPAQAYRHLQMLAQAA